MVDVTADRSGDAGGWRDLLGPKYLGASTVLAGGVALYATNEFLTISLLPSAVADIGGQRLYAWVTTVYLVASVVAATTVSATLARLGPRWSYLAASACSGWAACVRAGADHGAAVGRPRRAGRRRRSARGAGLRSDQFRAAAVVVDQGVGARVGDVGRRHAARSRPRAACSRNSVRGVGHSVCSSS